MKKTIICLLVLVSAMASCTLRPELAGTNSSSGSMAGDGTGTGAIQLIHDGPYIFTGNLLTFKWSEFSSANFVRLDLFRNNQFEQIFLDYAPNTGMYAWAIPTTLALNDADLFSVKLTVYDALVNPVIVQEIQSAQFQIKQATGNNGLSDVVVNAQNITLTMIDNGALIDGDVVQVILNGVVIQNNLTLLGGSGSAVPVSLNLGSNTLQIVALNEGTSPPNTAQLSISAVVSGNSVQEWRLTSGEMGTVKIFCQP